MIGSTISHYKILEKLGEGGMGIVYKATDTKLNRTVALKFLPAQVAGSEQDRARFLQEAQAAAGLNHPNICTIHGIEEHDQPDKAGLAGNQQFIVMEFVDGQMLQEKKSGLTMKQALDIGIQIAEGLAAAHEKGIVHRDIKPENIMIRKDGRVQVMDFGLAKLRGASRLTKEGSTVGTAGYMSPEQVQGQETDHRSDIFALGVLLYEMLAGELPFKGVHETAIAYEIVNVDSPPMTSIKPEIPPELDSVVLECLEKDINERTQSAKQVAIDLTRFKKASSKARVSRIRPVPSLESKGKGLFGRPAVIGAIIAVALATGLIIGFLLSGGFRDQLPPRQLISSILPPNGTYFADYSGFNTGGGHFGLSSDGSMLAHVSPDSLGRYLLWIRKLGETESIRIEGSIGAAYPFWSPDNRSIGFFAEGKLKALEISAGTISVLADAPNGRGGAWLSGNKIVFASTLGSGLYILDIATGDSRVLTVRDSVRGDVTHRWPHVLPNGTTVIYLARTTGKSPNMWHAIDVSGKESKDIAKASSQAEYSHGHLLFAEGTTLFAVRFDPDNLTTSGEPFPVYAGVQFDPGFNRSFFSVSHDGLLVFKSGLERGGWDVFWVNSLGKRIKTILQGGEYYNLRQSPDRRWMAFTRYEPTRRNRDIHILDLERGVQSRFTFQEWYEDYPVWSPDSRKIVFGSQKEGVYDLYIKNAGGGAPETPLYKSADNKAPTDWSGSRQMILFTNSGTSSTGGGTGPMIAQPRTDRDIWALSPDAPEKAFVVLQTPFDEYDARFSPDGKWITYVSNESGKEEVYVRSFTASETRVQVSVSGGVTPRWNANGTEIFFWTKEGTLLSAAVLSTDGQIRLARAVPVFVASIRGQNTFEEVSADGKSFLLTAYTIDENPVPLSVSIGWEEKGASPKGGN